MLRLRFGGEGGAWLVDSDHIAWKPRERRQPSEVNSLAPTLGIEKQLRDPQVERWRSWARESLVRHVTLNINRPAKRGRVMISPSIYRNGQFMAGNSWQFWQFSSSMVDF